MGLFSRRRSSTKRIATKPFRPRFELLEARQMLAAADLSAWAGVGNVTSPNNYSVVSSTSAGGTFDGRRFGTGEAAAYLADAALLTTGGAALPDLNRTTAGGFGATGTLTFDASANTSVVDPVFYYGFFDNENLAQGAFGFSIADQTATSFRFRATAGTTQGTTTVLGDGTYTYNIDVNNAASGANTVRVRLFNTGGATVVNATVAIPTTLALQADSFGFLQPLAASDADNTFSMTVSNINYTGETQVGGTAPLAPSSLAATAAGSSQINLTWVDNATNETGFEVDRATNITFTAGLTSLPDAAAGATSYSATGLAASTTYYFRVRATNAVGDSANSNTASATTADTVPATPTSLAATAAGSSQINLTWVDNATNETGYEIDRATNSGFTAGLTSLPNAAAGATSYSATGLAASTAYWFRVRATNAVGDSANSNTANATTQAASTQDSLIEQDGVYSTAYSQTWAAGTLATGKEIVAARPAAPTAITLTDGSLGGTDYRIVPVVGGVATVSNRNFDLFWTSTGPEGHQPDKRNTNGPDNTLYFFHGPNQGINKVVFDNVTISQKSLNRAYNSIRIWDVDTVEFRNCTFIGDVVGSHIELTRVRSIFVDGMEVKGDAGGYSGGGIFVQNGDGGTALGTLEYLVIQNSYFHDATLTANTGPSINRDGILIHTFKNGVIFNNTFENWVQNGNIDSALDLGLRTAYPAGVVATMRVERNQFLNNSFVKTDGNPGSDAVLRHDLIWANNIFLNTGIVDYHYGYRAHYVNNTHVFDPSIKGPKLTTIYSFHEYWAYGDPTWVNVYNNVISQVGNLNFKLYLQKDNSAGAAQTKYNQLAANNNWIHMSDATPHWFLAQGTGGGPYTSTTFLHWQGRGFDVNTVNTPVQFDPDGYTAREFRLASEPSGYNPHVGYNAGGPMRDGLEVVRDFNGNLRGTDPVVGAYQSTGQGLLAAPAGDYNRDFLVDGADLATWSSSFGLSSASALDADGDADGDVDGTDFLVWQRNLRPAAALAASTLASVVATEELNVAAGRSAPSDKAFAQLAGEGLPQRPLDELAPVFRRTFEGRRSRR